MGLSTPTREQAKAWLGEVAFYGNLEVMAVEPGGQSKPRWIASLLDLVEFLVPLDEQGRLRSTVNYVDPAKLVTWVRDAVRDAELAERMQVVIASGKGYSVLAPALRELALARVVQCWELLKQPEAPTA